MEERYRLLHDEQGMLDLLSLLQIEDVGCQRNEVHESYLVVLIRVKVSVDHRTVHLCLCDDIWLTSCDREVKVGVRLDDEFETLLVLTEHAFI